MMEVPLPIDLHREFRVRVLFRVTSYGNFIKIEISTPVINPN